MDGIKLKKWRQTFFSRILDIQIQNENYFSSKTFDNCFILLTDELNESLSLEITDPQMPDKIRAGLENLLIATKPEDSI